MAKPEVKFDAALYTALFIDDDDVTEDIFALSAGLNVLESISSGIFIETGVCAAAVPVLKQM